MPTSRKNVSGAQKKAALLAKTLLSASKQFTALKDLSHSPERSQLLGALGLLSAAAIPWLRAVSGTRPRKPRSPGVTAGWVGGG